MSTPADFNKYLSNKLEKEADEQLSAMGMPWWLRGAMIDLGRENGPVFNLAPHHGPIAIFDITSRSMGEWEIFDFGAEEMTAVSVHLRNSALDELPRSEVRDDLTRSELVDEPVDWEEFAKYVNDLSAGQKSVPMMPVAITSHLTGYLKVYFKKDEIGVRRSMSNTLLYNYGDDIMITVHPSMFYAVAGRNLK